MVVVYSSSWPGLSVPSGSAKVSSSLSSPSLGGSGVAGRRCFFGGCLASSVGGSGSDLGGGVSDCWGPGSLSVFGGGFWDYREKGVCVCACVQGLIHLTSILVTS